MKNIDNFDEIQLNLMIEQLIFFENKKLELSVLLINLERLFHAMKNISDEWEEEFLSDFSTLESINAERPKMEENEINNLISQSVCNLKVLIESRLR